LVDGRPVPALGDTSEPQITKIEGGGRKYSYALPGLPEDEYLTASEPPTGFEPLKASADELETWGFPPRPVEAEKAEIEQWRTLVGAYREAVVSPGCDKTNIKNPTLYEWPQNIWSGYIAVQENNPYKWHAVTGTYYQTYDHGSCSPEAAVSQWIGLGGVFSNRFMQTGTTTMANGSMYAWIELFAGEYSTQYIIPNFAVYAQDYMQFYLGYDLATQWAYFYATNTATGQTILTQTPLGPQFYDGSSAEWIDEAPQEQENHVKYEMPLLNFNTITWWSNTAQNEANEALPIGSLQNWRAVSKHGNHDTHAPSALSNYSNFSDYYYTCN
jgi:hypothetical protein